jgi:hypothetical protein|nr:MAG TPA: hypothetical protein [Caudoviricetes sp.]
MNQVKFLKVYGIVFRCGNTEKTRFVETEEDISYNIKRAVELLANQGVIADEILQIAELNQRKVYEISK